MTASADIVESLRRIDSPGSFATHFNAPAGELALRVRGVGPIRLPLTAATARKLSAVSIPASHGFKEQTRLDVKVRDSGEIAATRIEIDEARWRNPLAAYLTRIRRSLGLPSGSALQAQLHNLLVYGPGQHFAPHRDSEKSDRMIGTLVVSLPSVFTGGTMSIRHHEATLRVGGSKRELTLIAFYADCEHEILPVTQGYRVVLTYNLILEAKPGVSTARVPPSEELQASIRRFFATSPPPRWKGDDRRSPPDRLVYLLDHEYTQKGLRWNLLKNADAKRAAALRQAAQVLDCEVSLALADVHETWACEEPYSGYGGRWYGDDDDEGDDDDANTDASDYELTDLIDSEVELRHWVGTDGTAQKIATGVAAAELCFTKPSSDFEPFESEHEGYTGNAGNTVEHWYHRAAVVLWPRQRNFIIRAKASPRWAIAQIAQAFKAGHPQAALDNARRLQPFWKEVAWRPETASLIAATLKVTARFNDPALAAALLEPFSLTRLNIKTAPAVTQLLTAYGLDWWRKQLRAWAAARQNQYDDARHSWVVTVLPELSRAVCTGHPASGPALAETILEQQWEWLTEQAKHASNIQRSSERDKQLLQLGDAWLGIVRASHWAGRAGPHQRAISFLTARDAPWPLPLAALRAAHSLKGPPSLRELRLRPLHEHCTAVVAQRLDEPPRADDDWSIGEMVVGTGPLHATLVKFLRAPDRVRIEWPLVKEGRRYVHGVLDAGGLPVTHVTRRTGRPFTLVLEKTADIFERDAQQRRSWRKDLQWLRRTTADF